MSEETLEQIWVSGLPAKVASQVVTDAVATVMVIVADVEESAAAVVSTGDWRHR